MGLNNENAMRLVFDIETAPLPEAVDYIESADAPGNYKDPAKIAAFISEKNQEQFERSALDVDLCQIVAISAWAESDEQPLTFHAGDCAEVDLLKFFWNEARGRHLVGFNCLGFDLPVLLRRSLYLGVATPAIQIGKYRHPDVTDLMFVLSFDGALKMRGLSFYAKRFGIQVEDDVTGAQIGSLVAAGEWDKVKAHVVADVRKTAKLAEKLGYFNNVPAGAF